MPQPFILRQAAQAISLRRGIPPRPQLDVGAPQVMLASAPRAAELRRNVAPASLAQAPSG